MDMESDMGEADMVMYRIGQLTIKIHPFHNRSYDQEPPCEKRPGEYSPVKY